MKKFQKIKFDTIDRIIAVAKKYPQRIAYVNDNDSITYSSLIRRAMHLSKILNTYKEKYVVIYGNKESFMPITILACLISRKTYVPIDYYCPKKRFEKILKQLNSYIIISDEKVFNFQTHTISNLKPRKNRYTLNNDICYVISTSGSTGTPKCVPITYSNLDNFVKWILKISPLDSYPNSIVMNQASFSFDLSVADFYYSLCKGHTLIAYNNFCEDFAYTFNILRNKKINILFVTPSFIRLCLLDDCFKEMYYPDLKCIYFCGEQLTKNIVSDLFSRFRNINIINAYGPTEATSAVSFFNVVSNEYDKYDVIPCGSLDKTACKIEIVNDEIVLSGKSVFKNYVGNKRVIKKYRTGDIGYIDNNLLFCRGRFDRQIKYSGYRICLDEIENYINSIEDILDCRVEPIYKNNVVYLIKAYIVCKNAIAKDKIKRYLNKYLPKYMIPGEIIYVDRIELTNNGKK